MTATFEEVTAWLRDRGTEAIEHPGGTLYAHLVRVHDKLSALGHSLEVRLAGLTHAAYGTDGFDLALLDPADREPLRALIGQRAEDLVHLYGACDRSRTWKTLEGQRQVFDRWTGEYAPLPDGFADLSVVNELDVAEQDPGMRARYGDYFRALFTSWEPLLSAPVAAEARAVFG